MLTLYVSYWCYPIALIVIGSVHRTFANLLHEGSHNLLATNKVLNRIYGAYLTGYPIFHMVMPYMQSHLQGHHGHLGDPEKDPDFHFHIQCGLYNIKEKTWVFFTKNFVLAVIGYRSLAYIRYIFRDRIFFNASGFSPEKRKKVKEERIYFLITWAIIIAVLAWVNGLTLFLFFWIVPMFTTGIAIGWFAELAEHYPLPEVENAPMLLTRNRHGWWIENFLFGRHGDRLHLIHHLSPAIPCYNLKAAHKILLKDECYRAWDGLWGGIFTRTRPGQETLVSYVKKYRNWQRNGGKQANGQSFGLHVLQAYLKLVKQGDPEGESNEDDQRVPMLH